jgi:hypothetical protein
VVLEEDSSPTAATAVIIAVHQSVVKLTSTALPAEAETAAIRATTAEVMAEVAVASSADLVVAVATLVVLQLLIGALGEHTVVVAEATTPVRTKKTFQVRKKAMV